jgi:hypothetical protein
MIPLPLALLLGSTKLVVDFAAREQDEAWIAAAFAANTERDLAGLDVEFVDAKSISTKDCWGRKPGCLVQTYAGAGVDIIFLGTLDEGRLELEVYEGWLKTRVSRDAIDLDDRPDLLRVRNRMLAAVTPFFQSGGLLEKKPWIAGRSKGAGVFALLLPMLGGAAWGLFVLLHLGIAFPIMTGLGNVRHANVGMMLRAWCAASGLRVLLLALFYAPFAFAFARAPSMVWMLLVPLVGLGLHFGVRFLVDRWAARLDRKLVIGEAGAHNRWHPILKKYFVGYVRRLGIDLDRALLDRVLFLPGNAPGVLAYGGGLGAPRIVVHEKLLEVALHATAEGPQFQDEDDRGLDPGDAFGVIVPGGAIPEARKRRPSRARRGWPRLGQHETLLGAIVPLPAGESVPLIIDDPDEYSVLRDLLTAHYAAFEPDRYGEEADDTDPTQLDFLFGALLREMGSIQRQDPILFVAHWPAWLSRYPTIVADGYAALNRGLDPLIQFLFHLRTGSTELLTARADEPTLEATSIEILRRTGSGEGRLNWLAQHSFEKGQSEDVR